MGAGIEKRHSGKTAADIGGKGFLSRYSILHSCKGGMNAMKKTELKELYQMMFPNYPDIVTVKQLQVMLGVSRHLAYKLINNGEIQVYYFDGLTYEEIAERERCTHPAVIKSVKAAISKLKKYFFK